MNEEYTQSTIVWEGEYYLNPARIVHRVGEYFLEVKDRKDRMGGLSWQQVDIPKLGGSWVNIQSLIGELLRGRVTKMGEKLNE